MRPQDIIHSSQPEHLLAEIITRLHRDGPVDQEDLETLAYMKLYHPELFSTYESMLMYLLGLFYKTGQPKDLLSLAYSTFSIAIQRETGQIFTPVQASIKNQIVQNKYFSFSAPTSAGKSFLFRELIREQNGDIVIVVPSRALIAEYMLAVKEIVCEDKNILVLQFVDDVNKLKTLRRIFIVTPERASELFKLVGAFNISLFLYDEAQISEEKVRGLSFDALVRRAEKHFPLSKKVFAHPFVSNPEAQLLKHKINQNSAYMAYYQNAVGKIYLKYNKENSTYDNFSPFIDDPSSKNNTRRINWDIAANTISSGGNILIYISKSSIYDRSFEIKFKRYVSLCQPVEDSDALDIIKEIGELIGASGKNSELVELMKKGIVIHHGSIPLSVRFLIERFTNKGYARICFATSTLAQGVNMPFDLVWVENLKFTGTNEDKTIGLKNLIGRAGRSTNTTNQFDVGYVVVNNIKTFVKVFNGPTQLTEISKIDEESEAHQEDLAEFIDAMRNESMDDRYNLPESKVERLNSSSAKQIITELLDLLFKEGQILTCDQYKSLPKKLQDKIKIGFKSLFESSLRRKVSVGEQTVLSTSIAILLWQIQGKSFRELVGLRYSYLTQRDKKRDLHKQFNNKEISSRQYHDAIRDLKVKFTPIATQLPDSSLGVKAPRRFKADESVLDINYDLLVYDTYDYLDKVISFSLADIYTAAFDQFYLRTNDDRAQAMVNYFKYGTNDPKEIWLLRYGFTFEDIELILKHVVHVDENEIIFSKSIKELAGSSVMLLVDRYL